MFHSKLAKVKFDFFLVLTATVESSLIGYTIHAFTDILSIFVPIPHRIHVWYIYLHLP